MTYFNESVNVWVFFRGVSILPLVFFWKGRRIKVDKVNLVHTSKDGSNLLYHFSVSAGGNFYRLRFELKNLKWFLEEVEE